MNQQIILTFVALCVLASPAIGQDVRQSPAAGQAERKDVVKEPDKPPVPDSMKDSDKEGQNAGQGVEKGKGKASKEASQQTETASKKSQEDWGFRWDNHPSLRLGPGTRVDFRLRLQEDLQDSAVERAGDGDGNASTDLARRRFGIDGEILNVADYQVEREIGDDRDPWRDVYVNYKQFRVAQVQGGKFKLPFSLDENTSPTNLDFAYRSRIAALLAPGRDMGLMVHGRTLSRGVLRYEFGVFGQDGSNARTLSTDRVHGEQTFAGRAVVQPYRSTKSLASDLAFGVAFTESDLPEGVSDLRGRTELDDAFYRPEILVGGQRRRFGLEARWRPGPFSIKSEYIRLSDQRLGQSIEDTDLTPFVSAGWYVSGTWAVTGEKKADGLDTPRRPLFQGGFGAVELGMRVERIRFGSGGSDPDASNAPRTEVVLGNSDLVYTFGANWYANRWIKIQTNVVRNAIAFPDQGPMPTQPVFWSRIVRFQFSM